MLGVERERGNPGEVRSRAGGFGGVIADASGGRRVCGFGWSASGSRKPEDDRDGGLIPGLDSCVS